MQCSSEPTARPTTQGKEKCALDAQQRMSSMAPELAGLGKIYNTPGSQLG